MPSIVLPGECIHLPGFYYFASFSLYFNKEWPLSSRRIFIAPLSPSVRRVTIRNKNVKLLSPLSFQNDIACYYFIFRHINLLHITLSRTWPWRHLWRLPTVFFVNVYAWAATSAYHFFCQFGPSSRYVCGFRMASKLVCLECCFDDKGSARYLVSLMAHLAITWVSF